MWRAINPLMCFHPILLIVRSPAVRQKQTKNHLC